MKNLKKIPLEESRNSFRISENHKTRKTSGDYLSPSRKSLA